MTLQARKLDPAVTVPVRYTARCTEATGPPHMAQPATRLTIEVVTLDIVAAHHEDGKRLEQPICSPYSTCKAAHRPQISDKQARRYMNRVLRVPAVNGCVHRSALDFSEPSLQPMHTRVLDTFRTHAPAAERYSMFGRRAGSAAFSGAFCRSRASVSRGPAYCKSTAQPKYVHSVTSDGIHESRSPDWTTRHIQHHYRPCIGKYSLPGSCSAPPTRETTSAYLFDSCRGIPMPTAATNTARQLMPTRRQM